MAGTIIIKNAVQREKGYMYYVDGEGNICKAKMATGGRKPSKKVKKK